jgi:hypothetical protein
MAIAPPPSVPGERDLDALVEEARARQRRRRIGTAGSLVALAGLTAAIYVVTVGAAGPRIAGGPIPRAAAAACTRAVTPVGHTKTVNNTRPLGGAGWIGGIVADQGFGAVKTVIEPNWQSKLASFVLRGWRCSDGRPLRFWFSNAQLPFHGRGSVQQLASLGSRHLTVRIADLRPGRYDLVGYVLFSSPGKWVVDVQGDERTRATVLFDFPH